MLPWFLPAQASTGVFFVPNRGQTEPDIRFTVRGPQLTASFLQREIRFKVGEDEVGMLLSGANGAATLEGRKELPGRANFLSGSRSRSWLRDVPLYGEVLYRGIYEGIDMLYEGSKHNLKSNFVVKPGADPSLIRFRYTGVESLAIDPSGALMLKLPGGTLREEAPEAYQQTGRNRRIVQIRFRIFPDRSVGFDLEEYDHAQALIIDPTISCSTYLGGTGIDAGTAIATDSAGSVYVAGWTDSADLRTQNSLRSKAVGTEAFVAKFSADGQTLIYCTYLGGNGEDRAYGIAVDGSGNAYITGSTSSTDWPVVNASQRALAGVKNAFVAKLNSAGNGLVYSTYFGGRGYDTGNGIALDATGSAYVAGETTSTDLPVHSPYQGSSSGGSDAFVLKLLAAGNGIEYSTYLGGRADDRARAIAVDRTGAVYITGDTSSPDFPTLFAFQSTSGGNQDAFVAKLNRFGGLAYSTYLGGSGGTMGLPETGAGIAIDTIGNAYVAGTTSSFNFPLLSAVQATHAGSQPDAFVAKINTSGNGLIYSTYLGGSSIDVATSIAVDVSGQAYVAGYTASTDFPAASAGNSGGYDGFLVSLTAAGTRLLTSMYFGGSGNDTINALAIGQDAVYVAGQTLSGNLPIRNAVQPVPGGSQDAFIGKIPVGRYFVPITPCRVADTRWPAGAFGGPMLSASVMRTFPIPTGGCNIPSTAAAYSLNIAVVPNGTLGFLAIWPAGQPQPIVSTLNSFDGRVKANAAIVPAGSGGGISVLATGPTHVLIDINGYFVPLDRSDGLAYYPVTPCRLVDTRGGIGPLAGPAMTAGETRHIPVPSGSCGIPSSAGAYSANLTVIPKTTLDYISVWPTGAAMPGVSTLNSFTGAITSNAAIVQAGAAGSIDVYATSKTDLIVDVNGYFAPPAAGGMVFYGISPCRVIDTRNTAGPFGGPALIGSRSFSLSSGACDLPPEARAYSLNATVVPRATLGFLTLWPTGNTIPPVSTLNSFDGTVTSNAAIVPTADGSINAYATNETVLILDANGYFAP
jgi:hypothetical protein